MASTYINIKSTASNQAAYVRQAINNLQNAANQFSDLKANFDQMANGGEFAAFAGYLGTSEADAILVYNMWGDANTALQDSRISLLIAKLGNG